MAGKGKLNTDGKAVNVKLSYPVEKDNLIVVQGGGVDTGSNHLIGFAGADGESGATVSIEIAYRNWDLEVPAGLTVNVGDTIYINPTSLTGHYPQDGAYTTTAGGSVVPLLWVTEPKDANNIVSGQLIIQGK